MAPTGHTCAALSTAEKFVSPSLAGRRVDNDVRSHASSGERKDGLAVDVAARPDAKLALDAAIEIEQHVRVRRVDRAVRVELDEMRRHHLAVVGESLQLTIAALLAAGTEMIALDEQHLHQRPAVGMQVGSVHLDFLPRGRPHGASGSIAAIHDDGAHLAAAVGLEFRMMAEVRYIDSRRKRRLENRLTRCKGNRNIVDEDHCVGRAHASAPMCAAASSRPAISRALASAASRSTAGSKSPRIRRRS